MRRSCEHTTPRPATKARSWRTARRPDPSTVPDATSHSQVTRRTLPRIFVRRSTCVDINRVYGETHAFTNRFETFQLRNGVVLDGAQARAFMWSLNMMLRMEGCKTTWVEFDDEAYHADGAAYPAPPGR